ncbi:NRPS protein, partial [Apophysomyces sp. BC1015]
MAASATSLVTYPLSSAQTEIWLAQQLHPDSPVYSIAQYTVIEGAIDPGVFEVALRQVIGEADSLRLQFVETDEGLRQAIGSPAWSMPVLDFSAEADPHASAQAWMCADYEQPVDLVQGPLFCYALLKVAPEQWIWYQRTHHIIMDGYAFFLIAQRVAQVYSALCVGREPAPGTLGSVLQLLDSDAQYQTSAQRERDEAYWLKHCANWPEPTTLTSRTAPALQHRLRQTAPASHSRAGRDVVLGFPVTARLGADRHIPGTLAHDIPLRFTVQPEMNLSSLLQQATQQIQRGFRYQRYPSEALRRRLGLPSGQALFGATVNVMPFDYDLSFDGYPSTNHNLLNGPVDDLMLGIYWTPASHQLRIDFNANPACYTVEALEAHQRRFVRFRLAHILTDAAPDIVLADAAGRAALGGTVLAHRTVLDPNTLPEGADTNPSVPALTSSHLVYVIYTSGSTDTSKGVMVEHRSLVNLCIWHNDTFNIQNGCRSALTAGVAFDACAWEIWPNLVCGGTLFIPPCAVHNDVPALLHWWQQQPLDTAFLVTPLAAIALSDQKTPAGLRHLLTGGDRFPPLVRSLPAGLALMNQYGPTETTVVATSGRLSAEGDLPHIGRPIANTRIYLLDAHGQPVPLGAVGKLYIGGAGVARGYLNRPELTAECFVHDPFSAEPDARMYKTGDLARYLPDGNLEFLGRNDHQVKLRGFRIELGEIEACLAKHAQVRDAVMLAMGEGQDKRLVAYVVAEPDDALVGTLRTHVAAALPEYMVPSAFVRLDALPLTPNGKLDRRA